jgi:hypothetical protein
VSSTTPTPARLSLELSEQWVQQDDLLLAPSQVSVDSRLWEELDNIHLDGLGDPVPRRAYSEPGAATPEDASDEYRTFANVTRRVSCPPNTGPEQLTYEALLEWERDIEARERQAADEVARLQRVAARCDALFTLGFSRGRVDAEMRLADRDVEWYGGPGWWQGY